MWPPDTARVGIDLGTCFSAVKCSYVCIIYCAFRTELLLGIKCQVCEMVERLIEDDITRHTGNYSQLKKGIFHEKFGSGFCFH